MDRTIKIGMGKTKSIDKTVFLTKNIKPIGPSLVFGRGAIVVDAHGKDYIDFSSQTLNLNLGQCHPKIVQTVIKTAKELTYISSRFTVPVLVDLAEKLVRLAPQGLERINLKLCNGSDANESAIKRARGYSGKHFVASFENSHIGESCETLCASGHSRFKPYLGGSGKYVMIEQPDPKKAGIDSEYDSAFFEKLEKISTERNDIGGLIIEPIMVDAGVIVFPKHYLQKIRGLCSENNVALIFDEVQLAFGWLGSIFASQYFGVTPDMLTMGKGISGGYPLAGVLMKKEFDVLEYGEDELTYGGHPLACATALATLEVLLETDILKQVKEKSKIIEKRLEETKEKCNIMEDYRGSGLVWGIEIKEKKQNSNDTTKKIYYSLMENGLISRIAKGGKGNVLILKPPLVIEEHEIERAFEIIERSLYRQK